MHLTPKPSTEGVITTSIEDNDVQAILGIFHSAQDAVDMDRSDLYVLFFGSIRAPMGTR